MEQTTSSKETKPPLLMRAFGWLAYPISLLTGGYFGYNTVTDELYDTIKHNKNFQQNVRSPHWERVKAITEAGEDVPNKLAAEHVNFAKKQVEFFESKGLHTPIDYIKGISRKQQLKAAVTFAGTTALALGVLLSLSENKTLQALFSAKEAADKDSGIS